MVVVGGGAIKSTLRSRTFAQSSAAARYTQLFSPRNGFLTLTWAGAVVESEVRPAGMQSKGKQIY